MTIIVRVTSRHITLLTFDLLESTRFCTCRRTIEHPVHTIFNWLFSKARSGGATCFVQDTETTTRLHINCISFSPRLSTDSPEVTHNRRSPRKENQTPIYEMLLPLRTVKRRTRLYTALRLRIQLPQNLGILESRRSACHPLARRAARGFTQTTNLARVLPHWQLYCAGSEQVRRISNENFIHTFRESLS